MAEVARLFPNDEPDDARAEAILQACRIAEALIFVSADPVEEKDIAKRMPERAASSTRSVVPRTERLCPPASSGR